MELVEITWSAVYLHHTRISLKKRDPICAWTNRNASTQAIEFDPSCSGQTRFNRPCVDPRNVDTER